MLPLMILTKISFLQETQLELTSAYYLQVFGVKTNKFVHLNCPSVFTVIIFPLLSCYDYLTLVQVAQSSWCFADSILIGEFSVFRSLRTVIIFPAKRTMYFLQLLKTSLLSETMHILSDPICIYLLEFYLCFRVGSFLSLFQSWI